MSNERMTYQFTAAIVPASERNMHIWQMAKRCSFLGTKKIIIMTHISASPFVVTFQRSRPFRFVALTVSDKWRGGVASWELGFERSVKELSRLPRCYAVHSFNTLRPVLPTDGANRLSSIHHPRSQEFTKRIAKSGYRTTESPRVRRRVTKGWHSKKRFALKAAANCAYGAIYKNRTSA